MRQWIAAFVSLVLSACAVPYGGARTVGSEYGVSQSPYAHGESLPYRNLVSPWGSPYGANTGFGGANRFSPKKGLTCERDRHICYDRYGVDYFETQKYLGNKSAKRGIKRYGEQVYIFTPQQGVVCDRRSQSCSDGNGLNASLTRKYFSKNDTRRVASWAGAELFAPQAGVACSRATQICSDGSGPSVNLTELYLGRAAALDLANQQNQPATLTAPMTEDPVFAPVPEEAPAASGLQPVAAPEPAPVLQPVFPEHEIFSIKMAVEEALVNAIKHGNQMDPGKSVRVAWTVAAERFDVRITDEGPGFNPDDVPDPTAPENLERPCGRGLLLIRYYMTEVTFTNNGRTIVMAKLANGKKSA